MIIEYKGEYGSEIGCFIPYIHYLCDKGFFKKHNLKVKTYYGMKPYYFFLDDDEIEFKMEMRLWIDNRFRTFLPDHLMNEDLIFSNMKSLPKMMDPPNYTKQYGSIKLPYSKPIFIIQNKYTNEWCGPPRNYFDTLMLDNILDFITKLFTVIYIRSDDIKVPEYSYEENERFLFKFDDKAMITQKYPDVILFENLLKEYPNYDFNTLKCIIHSNALFTLSTIAGYNSFDAYFPSKHYIYKVNAPEIYSKEYYQNMHNMLCPNHREIYFTSNKDELIEALKKDVASLIDKN